MDKCARDVLSSHLYCVYGAKLVPSWSSHHRRYDLCACRVSLRDRSSRPFLPATTHEKAVGTSSRRGQVVLQMLSHEGREGVLRTMSSLLPGLRRGSDARAHQQFLLL